jgi:hypothetical protein
MRRDVVNLKLVLHVTTGGTGVGTRAQDLGTQAFPAFEVVPPMDDGVVTGGFVLGRMRGTAATGHELGTTGVCAVLHIAWVCVKRISLKGDDH